MSKKVVFLDIDGTILDHEKKIPESTKDAVNKLKERGVIVAIATGRAPFMFQDILAELDIDSYISFNGQYAVHQGKVVHENFYSAEQMEQLMEFSSKSSHPIIFQSVDEMRATVSDHPQIESGMNSLKKAYPDEDAEYYKKVPIFQALLFNEAHEQTYYEKNLEQFRFVRWHEYSCDVLPRIGSKAHGIEQFINELNIDWKDTYAFGDGLNDLEMIETVRYGIAMGNSVEELKKKAYLVTDHVDDDGLSKGLKRLKLID
ncbi:Cof-type HAD-IIB family hydrolase [Gracilibacillus oryzae]|uniref:Cof-type HAD-IIB family hydrolase n=1 Tax=Gracilibacillus oryzae TaxID=1672701 RepID=A0A7C8GUP1_9BACI|nr:Cof-type HAD-IIB family hydrolase [Gracilibacillus oryzae]KAB8138601.1 Cof-type HAD-IIB family hydrolase [Gracilibacillus oryzae]